MPTIVRKVEDDENDNTSSIDSDSLSSEFQALNGENTRQFMVQVKMNTIIQVPDSPKRKLSSHNKNRSKKNMVEKF